MIKKVSPCWSKAAVLMGLAAVVPAEGRAARMALSHMEKVLVGAA